jgi:hypothetical protein
VRRLKAFVAACLVAAAVTAVVPSASATAAMGPCTTRPLGNTLQWRQGLALVGQYTRAGAIDVRLTCGIVQNGVTIARYTDQVIGPVAALAEVVDIPVGPYSLCYDVFITSAFDFTYTRSCP